MRSSREDCSACKGDNDGLYSKVRKYLKSRVSAYCEMVGGYRKRNEHSGVSSKNPLQADPEHWYSRPCPFLVCFKMNELPRKSSQVHADLSLGPIILAVLDSVPSATPEPTDVSDL